MSATAEPLSCNDARGMVGAYVDGELSEAQASVLRQHLLACVTCRGSTQSLKSLKRWFAAEAAEQPVTVPTGFAARVTRRAFAGDTGERNGGSVSAPLPQVVAVGASDTSGARSTAARLHSFVVGMTGLAAAAAVVAVLAIQAQKRPAERDLRADDSAIPSTSQLIDQLDALNRAEEQGELGQDRAPESSQPASAGQASPKQ